MSQETVRFNVTKERDAEIRRNLMLIYDALKRKGYNPVDQLVGYIFSEDPTYITAHNNARNIVRKIDRYDILEAIVRSYFQL